MTTSVSTIGSAGQCFSRQEPLGVRQPLGSPCRWPCESGRVFAAVLASEVPPPHFVLSACVPSGMGVSSLLPSMSQKQSVRSQRLHLAHDTWPISLRTRPGTGVLPGRGCFLSHLVLTCHLVILAGPSLAGAPEESRQVWRRA